jgi:hypothetical protein
MTAACISSALVTSMRVTPRGVRLADRAADQRDFGASFLRGARDGKAHLAARQVGDAAHRVDRLEGRAGGDQHFPAGEQLRLEVAISSSRISSGSIMRPSPVSPQACSPQAGPSMA